MLFFLCKQKTAYEMRISDWSSDVCSSDLSVERLMRTSKALQRVIMKNKAGHLHFASNWYGGTKMYREDAWAWQKPYSFVVTHAPILMGDYNGNPHAEALITGLMDGWAAHAKKDGGGRRSGEHTVELQTLIRNTNALHSMHKKNTSKQMKTQ